MKICECYVERSDTRYLSDYERGYQAALGLFDNKTITETYSYCLGTKEQERCSCGGDPSKCNFYPEKRKEKENGKTKN